MEPISATMITYNEERNIEGALKSLAWASEIVIVDSGSTDGTVEIGRKHTDRIFHRDWTGYVDQKSYAVEKATHQWIFSLDADERSSSELEREVQCLRISGFHYPGYRIPRVAFFMNRWIRHGDWYPDYQLRLFDRHRGHWQGGRVHESVRVNGTPGSLQGEIQHFTYRGFSDYLKRLEMYSSLAAADYCQNRRRSSALKLLGNPVATFLKSYLLKRGFLDGTPGLMVSVMAAISVYCKYVKLYELQNSRRE